MRDFPIDRNMPAERDPRLLEALEDGESVVFATRPLPVHLLVLERGFHLAVGLGMLGCAGFVYLQVGLGASHILDWAFVTLVCGPFMLFGGWVTMGALDELVRARRVLYAVTDRRCLIWWPRPHFAAEDAPPEFSSLERLQVAGYRPAPTFRGAGSLVFREDNTNNQWPDEPNTTAVGFIAVPDVAEAERVIRETFEIDDETRWAVRREIQRARAKTPE